MVALFVVAVLAALAAAWFFATAHQDWRSEEHRSRIAAETRMAEWRMQQVTRSAFERMLDETRRSR